MPENIQRLIELLNLQRLLQNCDRTDLKNPIEDLVIRITCNHDKPRLRALPINPFLINGEVLLHEHRTTGNSIGSSPFEGISCKQLGFNADRLMLSEDD
jgi:hypothetical protein